MGLSSSAHVVVDLAAGWAFLWLAEVELSQQVQRNP